MMTCQWCEKELSEPEVYCDDCVEMLNATYDEETNECTTTEPKES